MGQRVHATATMSFSMIRSLHPYVSSCAQNNRKAASFRGRMKPLSIVPNKEDVNDQECRSGMILRRTDRFLGPSNSARKIPCHVPRTSAPLSMMTVMLEPMRLALM